MEKETGLGKIQKHIIEVAKVRLIGGWEIHKMYQSKAQANRCIYILTEVMDLLEPVDVGIARHYKYKVNKQTNGGKQNE